MAKNYVPKEARTGAEWKQGRAFNPRMSATGTGHAQLSILSFRTGKACQNESPCYLSMNQGLFRFLWPLSWATCRG